MHILIVEPNDSVGSILKALFEAKGFGVERVASADTAYEIARDRTPDAIFVDLSDENLALCGRLRDDANPAHLVVLSADGSDDARDRAAGAGARAFYTKPASPVALLKELDSLRVRASTPRLPAAAADEEGE